jgi:rhamnosyltransferase
MLTRSRPQCSIVVRAFNEEAHIGRLLTGISQQTIDSIEVILVDSGSTDGTLAIAGSSDWGFPVRTVHIHPEQFSFGKSLNAGIAETRSDIVVIASAHVYPVYPDWLEKLLEPFKDERVALVYGKQRGNSSTRYSEHQIFKRWYPEASQIRQSNPFCNNANAAIRQVLWRENPYDESLSGLEDLAWSKWVLEAGYSLAYAADAEIVHVHEDTPRGVFNRYRREAMAFKRIFPQEKFNFWDFLRLSASNIASDLANASREGNLSGNFSSILWFRLLQFWGTYRGYRELGPLTWELRQTFYYPSGLKSKPIQQTRTVKPIQYNDAG